MLGDGRKAGTDVGPLIHADARSKVEKYVRDREEGGCRTPPRRRARDGTALEKGYFFQPTIFTGVKALSRLEQEEIFGPVLSVIR